MRAIIAMFLLVGMLQTPMAFCQDDSDVATLKQENELLQAKLEAANLKIEKLEKQLAELKSRDRDDAVEDEEDPFAIGTAWSGSRNYTQNGPSQDFQDWQLKIITREGKKFTGEIHFKSNDDTQQTLEVSGSAPNTGKGPVLFKTQQKGIFQQSFKGVLAGSQISLTFTGTGVKGNAVKGTGTLKK